MPEVAHAGKYHRHSVFVAVGDAVAVAYRTAGLDHGVYSFFVGYLNTVGEGEIGVGRHYGAMQIETETFRFCNSLFQRIDPRSLPHTATQQLTVMRKYYRGFAALKADTAAPA